MSKGGDLGSEGVRKGRWLLAYMYTSFASKELFGSWLQIGCIFVIPFRFSSLYETSTLNKNRYL